MKYRKKPVVIEAVQWTGKNHEEIKSFCSKIRTSHNEFEYGLAAIIPTLEGEMTASPGDFIIKGVSNEFYPCKPDIFDKTYEKVTD